MNNNYCIGVDFGTDSVRALVVNADNGHQVASSVSYYRRWKEGLYCEPARNQFRQHPLDYLEGLETVIKDCLSIAGGEVAQNIRGMSIDTTGSTPVATNSDGIPLGLLPGFEDDPDALFILWKDHTAVQEMVEINQHAAGYSTDYLRYVGGRYSSEWFWSKLLHVLRRNDRVRVACYSWVEHADWMPFLLTGGGHVSQMKRNVCTAGHKALWSPEWGGLPPDEFFATLDPLLSGYTSRLYTKTYAADKPAGKLCVEWAQKLGLSTDVVVGMGAMDAHMAAVGGQIEPYFLSKVIGTSTCDMLVAPVDQMQGKYIQGICGLVNDSIIPGMIGMEAGQSAFGDVYAWFKELLAWPLLYQKNSSIFSDDAINQVMDSILPALGREAQKLPLQENGVLSTDWFNGRRTPDADPFLKASISNLSLSSRAPHIFYSLVEATCFGAKAIVERFVEQGVPVQGVIGVGGIARKSPFVMQMLADVLNLPIKINRAEQTGALGATMFAATAAGIYEKVEDAMNSMGQGFDIVYCPDENKVDQFQGRYNAYMTLGHVNEAAKI